MKLYMTPGSCSTGIHILMEELELPFEAYIVNLPAGDARVIEVMDYVVGTLHGQGYTRIFTTANYTPNEADHKAVQARGREIVEKGFAIIHDMLAGKDYVASEFSIADAALFYVEFWADKIGIGLPAHCGAHYERMLARPVVQRVLREEGYR